MLNDWLLASVLSIETSHITVTGTAIETSEMAEKTLEQLNRFAQNHRHCISLRQWKLLVPILRDQVRRRMPASFTLIYSGSAKVSERIQSGHDFYRAGEGAGVFALPDAKGHLYLEVVGSIVDESESLRMENSIAENTRLFRQAYQAEISQAQWCAGD